MSNKTEKRPACEECGDTGSTTIGEVEVWCPVCRGSSEVSSQTERKTARDYAKELYDGGMQCNCDLDRWQPEPSTGHSVVCRIHDAAFRAALRAAGKGR